MIRILQLRPWPLGEAKERIVDASEIRFCQRSMKRRFQEPMNWRAPFGGWKWPIFCRCLMLPWPGRKILRGQTWIPKFRRGKANAINHQRFHMVSPFLWGYHWYIYNMIFFEAYWVTGMVNFLGFAIFKNSHFNEELWHICHIYIHNMWNHGQ
jgi:hypothetical protein